MKRTVFVSVTLLSLMTSCVRTPFVPTQFQPMARLPSANTDSVTVFLLERDLPPTFDRLGTLNIHTVGIGFGVHQSVENELQRIGRQKGANGAYRVLHGTYDHEHDGIVSYLLFRYTK